MVKYYYDKYTAASRKVVKSTYVGTAYVTNGFPSYNIVNDLFYSSGTYEYNTPGSLPVGRSVYDSVNGTGTIMRYDFVNANDVVSYRLELVPEPTKGALVQSNIEAEDGTYPANGLHTDGYWYVRGAVAGPLPKGTVVNSPYVLSSVGGRKTALMSNGWIVVVARAASYFFFYVDKRDGLGYRPLMYANSTDIASNDVAIAANGTMLHIVCGWGTTQIRHARVDVTTATNANIASNFASIIHNNLTTVSQVSLTVDPSTGYLHAAWQCRNSTHPNTHNVYTASSSNGGVTWNSPTGLTLDATTGNDRGDPTIVVYKGVQTVFFRLYDGSAFSLYAATFKGGSWSHTKVMNGGAVSQSYPSAVVDQTGIIHVVWTPNANAVYYSKSTDGGATWSIQTNIAYSSSYFPNYPSITVDKNNTVFVAWQQRMSGAYIEIQVRECNNGVWSAGKTIQSTSYNLRNPQTLYDPTFSVLFGKEAGSVGYPPVAYETLNQSVNFFGDITANNNPTIALTTEDNQTLYEASVFTIKGQAFDLDNGDAVTVRYQIDNEAEVNFGLAISDG